MTATVKAITARIPHLCDGCHWISGLRGKPTIGAGHRYLRHVTFRDDLVNQSGRPIVHKGVRGLRLRARHDGWSGGGGVHDVLSR